MYATATKQAMKEETEELDEAIDDDLHPAGVTLLKHIKPQHRNLYKAHLTKDTFNGSYKDRTDVLKAAKEAGHLLEDSEQVDEEELVDEAAKWRQGYRASGHPSGFKHKSGEVGPLGGTWDTVRDYDDDKKVPVQRHRDEIDPLAHRDTAGTSTTGKPLLPKNKQKNLKGMIARSAGKHGPVGHLPEEFVSEKNDSHTHAAHYEDPKTGEWSGMQLISAKDDQDAIKQAHSKCKDGCRLSKVERHMTVKEETILEAEVTTSADTPEIYVTDMLQGRVKGGKVNSFKSFKAQLRTDGEMKAPKEIDQGEDTREKQKITTNPGPVDVKMDDKLAGPTPFTHHATEKKVTSEEVRGELKHIRSKEEKHYSKEIGDFKKKLLGKQVNQEGKDPMMDAGVGSTPDFATNGSWKKETPWHKSKGPDVVTDKSGAKHTPMSKVRDLARNALKKTKNEVLGIAPDNN
jgi:hypothetical protein